MATESLLDRTFRLLDATNLTYQQIASGCGVGYQWLAKFSQRKIPSPGVHKVQRVHDFLSAYEEIRTAHSAPNCSQEQRV